MLWDERGGAPKLPKDLLLLSSPSPPSSRGNGGFSRLRSASARPSSEQRPVLVELVETDPLQAMARSRAAAAFSSEATVACRAEEDGAEARVVAAASATMPSAPPPKPAATLEDFLMGTLPPDAVVTVPSRRQEPRTSSARSPSAPPLSNSQPWRPGRLEAIIASRKDIDKLTWYVIELSYDGVQKVCHKRYNDFVEFDRIMRQQYPALGSCLLDLPPSGVVGLRHKLDIGNFNNSRQRSLQRYLDVAIELAGEQPVRRFLQAQGVPTANMFPPCATSWEERQRQAAQGGC